MGVRTPVDTPDADELRCSEVAFGLPAFRGERLSHVGIGLNQFLAGPVGWTIIDEHIAGRLFLALGESRYMGGENASAINIDLLVEASASLDIGASPVVNTGRLAI